MLFQSVHFLPVKILRYYFMTDINTCTLRFRRLGPTDTFMLTAQFNFPSVVLLFIVPPKWAFILFSQALRWFSLQRQLVNFESSIWDFFKLFCKKQTPVYTNAPMYDLMVHCRGSVFFIFIINLLNLKWANLCNSPKSIILQIVLQNGEHRRSGRWFHSL